MWPLSKTKTVSSEAPCKQVQLFQTNICQRSQHQSSQLGEIMQEQPLPGPKVVKIQKSQTTQQQRAGCGGSSCPWRGAQHSSHRLWWGEVPSSAPLGELLPLHSPSSLSRHGPTLSCCTQPAWTPGTTQHTRVLTQSRFFSFLFLSVCISIFTCVCVHLCMCIYGHVYTHK